MLKGLYLCSDHVLDNVYGPEERKEISTLIDIYAPPQSATSLAENPTLLQEAEVLLGSWGLPKLTPELLATAPNLKAIFYGAGSIKNFMTEEAWQRGITVSSAYAANAIPVSEYVLSQIFFCLKHGWQAALKIKQTGISKRNSTVPGSYKSTVGLISLGMIGRLVRERLRPFDLQVIAYDPYVSPQAAASLGVELCSLEELFRRSDVVSLHTPWPPS
jgi:phosphoglycerate dehydrogenase-like enzyme